MNGVITPGVSAGSNHVGAMVTWMAQVICPLGACFGAAAAAQRGQEWSQAASPVAPTTVPPRKWRRVKEAVLDSGCALMSASRADALLRCVAMPITSCSGTGQYSRRGHDNR